MFRKAFTKVLQPLGIGASVLCGIHCLAMPVLITVAPFMGELISHEMEEVLVLLSALVAFILFRKDYNVHNNPKPLTLLVFSVLFSSSGLFFLKGTMEVIFMVIGSVFMLTAYFVNWRFSQKCSIA